MLMPLESNLHILSDLALPITHDFYGTESDRTNPLLRENATARTYKSTCYAVFRPGVP